MKKSYRYKNIVKKNNNNITTALIMAVEKEQDLPLTKNTKAINQN